MLHLVRVINLLDEDTPVELVIWGDWRGKRVHTTIESTASRIKATMNLGDYKLNNIFNYEDNVSIAIELIS